MIRPIFIGILILLSTLSLSSQASLRAELSNSQIMIGDQVNLQIRLSQPGTVKVDIDLSGLEEIEGLEVIAEKEPVIKEDPGLHYLEKNITLTSFDSGEYVIPQIPVTLLQEDGKSEELYTNPIPLTVLTIPIATDSLQLAPIKDIDREKFAFRDSLPYLLGATGVIIFGLLIWWFFFRRPQLQEKAAPVIIRPPHEVALEKLDELKQQQLWQQGRIKDYYSQLTYIAREYLESRFQVPALENTTGEILQKIQSFPEIDQELRNELRQILTSSDMVKFAKAEPAATFHNAAFEQTRQFIDVTKAREKEVPEEEGQESEPQETEQAKD